MGARKGMPGAYDFEESGPDYSSKAYCRLPHMSFLWYGIDNYRSSKKNLLTAVCHNWADVVKLHLITQEKLLWIYWQTRLAPSEIIIVY